MACANTYTKQYCMTLQYIILHHVLVQNVIYIFINEITAIVIYYELLP